MSRKWFELPEDEQRFEMSFADIGKLTITGLDRARRVWDLVAQRHSPLTARPNDGAA